MQYTVTTDWPGGVYGSPTVSGSRAGGSIATCWATMLSFGKQGYIQSTREIIHTTKYIEKGLTKIFPMFYDSNLIYFEFQIEEYQRNIHFWTAGYECYSHGF